MRIQMREKIKDFCKNPIKFSFLSVILLSLVLLFGCKFHGVDFYTNRELAEQIAQSVPPIEVSESVKHLLNPKYNIYNCIFHIWGWFVILFVFSFCFRVNEFRKFKELTFLNRKLFVYLWINLSYLVWGFAYIVGFMLNLDKHVYNSGADSLAIPFFFMLGILHFIGIIYYPVINILSFVTFNTKIKRIFYNFIWAFLFLFWLLCAIYSFSWQFTYFHLILDLFYFISFIFIIYAMGWKKNLDLSKTNGENNG